MTGTTGHVLLPLYIYPSSVGAAWSDVYTSITSSPRTNFTIIINPSSGPGGAPGSYPNSDYVAAITQLRSGNPNVNLLGYVDTHPLTIPAATAEQDVLTYSQWSSYTQADIHMDGIFFDDMNGTYSTSNYAYYRNISSYTRATMKAGHQHVLFNPGAGVDSRFFALADEIIVFEDYYSNYNDNIIFNTPQQYWNQSSLLIHHFNDTAARQQQILDNLIGNKVQGLYISATGCIVDGVQINDKIYDRISRLWGQFCAAMF